MRSSVLIALALAAPSLVAGCFDTPHQTRVRVTVDASAMQVNSMLTLRQSLANGSGVVIAVSPILADAGAGVDGSIGGNPLEREIYWDGSRVFVFDIELPPGSYAGFTVSALAPVQCPDAGYILPSIAQGTAAGQTIRADVPTSISTTLALSTSQPTCAMP